MKEGLVPLLKHNENGLLHSMYHVKPHLMVSWIKQFLFYRLKLIKQKPKDRGKLGENENRTMWNVRAIT